MSNYVANEKKVDTFEYHRKQRIIDGMTKATQSIANMSAVLYEIGVQIRLCQAIVDEANQKMKELKESTQ
jgi:hypothetical protein